jgi:hypothetical protein
MNHIKIFENFQDKVWKKLNLEGITHTLKYSRPLNKKEIDYIYGKSKNNIVVSDNQNFSRYGNSLIIKAIDDDYYLLMFRIILNEQPMFYDIQVDGISRLVKYADFSKYLVETLASNKSKIDFDYAISNFDVDYEFIKMFDL